MMRFLILLIGLAVALSVVQGVHPRIACAQTAPPGAGVSPSTPAAAASPTASGGAAPTVNDLPIATRQNAFAIPLTVGLPADPKEQPLEVQLFVSGDRGKSWQLYNRQPPSATSFAFRAARDGEYWFAVRTLDRVGRLHPDTQPQAELRVIVDTVGPKLDLLAEAGPSGEMRVRWKAADPQLAPGSLKLEYQTASNNWEPLAVEVPVESQNQPAFEGMTTFWPKTPSRVVNVRGQIQDRAGNSVTVSRQVFMPRSAAGLAGETKPSAPPASPGAAGPVDPFAAQHQPSGPSGNSTLPPADPFRNVSTPLRPSGDGAIPSQPPVQPPTQPPGGAMVPPGGIGDTTAPGTGGNTAPGNSTPGSAATIVPSKPAAGEASATDLLQLPPGERPKLTNKKRFNLDYEIDSVGPSGVAKVELWGTRDGGRTWQMLGLDADKQSPFEVEVEGEGAYGFSIVIEANNGFAGKRPQSGDLADLWVKVDVTAPVCRITSAQYGQADQAGKLDIRWEASDKHLSQRPIALQFGEQPEGPWTTIAAGLPNNGQYLWSVDARLPRQVYLKIEAQDEAGNTGSSVLSPPVNLEGLAPKARIRAFTPAAESPSPAAPSP